MPKRKLTPDTPEEQVEENRITPDSFPDDPPAETTIPQEDTQLPEAAPLEEPPIPAEDAAQAEILSLDVTPLEAQVEAPQDRELDGQFGQDFPPIPAQELPAAAPQDAPASTTRRTRSDRQDFFGLDFNALDRGLTTDERQEWNSIYASFRGRSALTGTIIGVDRHIVNVRDPASGQSRQEEMYCAIVVPYRMRIVIPATGFAITSRKLALRSRRFYFSRRPNLSVPGVKLKCRVLAVGPRRCLVECFGHDMDLTQRELRYTAIHRPGEELDCIVKQYDAAANRLTISVKETFSNPFDGASERHRVGCRRQAVISGKYGGGVFCNLPDGTVCMCSYSYQYDDADFGIGDTAIVVIARYDMEKKQTYGKIIAKW